MEWPTSVINRGLELIVCGVTLKNWQLINQIKCSFFSTIFLWDPSFSDWRHPQDQSTQKLPCGKQSITFNSKRIGSQHKKEDFQCNGFGLRKEKDAAYNKRKEISPGQWGTRIHVLSVVRWQRMRVSRTARRARAARLARGIAPKWLTTESEDPRKEVKDRSEHSVITNIILHGTRSF
jgi:hypothetical protein